MFLIFYLYLHSLALSVNVSPSPSHSPTPVLPRALFLTPPLTFQHRTHHASFFFSISRCTLYCFVFLKMHCLCSFGTTFRFGFSLVNFQQSPLRWYFFSTTATTTTRFKNPYPPNLTIFKPRVHTDIQNALEKL